MEKVKKYKKRLAVFRNVSELLLFVAFRVARVSRFFLSVFVALHAYVASYLHIWTRTFIGYLLGWSLCEYNLIQLVRAIEAAIVGTQTVQPSEQVSSFPLAERR